VKPASVPITGEWVKKIWYIYTTEHYLAIKNEIMSFAEKWMKLETIMLGKAS
jgi:hypothetical protein